MEIRQRIIPEWENRKAMCNFCTKEATDEVVMNNTIYWYLCLEHKHTYDLVLAFQDLIQK